MAPVMLARVPRGESMRGGPAIVEEPTFIAGNTSPQGRPAGERRSISCAESGSARSAEPQACGLVENYLAMSEIIAEHIVAGLAGHHMSAVMAGDLMARPQASADQGSFAGFCPNASSRMSEQYTEEMGR